MIDQDKAWLLFSTVLPMGLMVAVFLFLRWHAWLDRNTPSKD